ncbi:MAG: hypothetical protein JST26_14140 [Bacteroidetes bacterium]|nr:hypothetical protein [Bacteroidota bacterium]
MWYKILPLLLVLMTAASCKKKTGPQGPTGPQGAQGVHGNANVVSTGTIAVTSWTLSSSNVYYSDYIPVPQLDSATYVSGSVQTYFMNSSSFFQLPFSDGYSTLMAEYGLHWTKLYYYNNDHSAPSAPVGAVIRIVIIPPAMKHQFPNLNYANYYNVKEAFKLAD